MDVAPGPGLAPHVGGNDALDNQIFSLPGVVGLLIKAPIGQQTYKAPSGQDLFHEGAKLPLIPSWSTVGYLPTQHQDVGSYCYRPL
jgi:hypothetical protein